MWVRPELSALRLFGRGGGDWWPEGSSFGVRRPGTGASPPLPGPGLLLRGMECLCADQTCLTESVRGTGHQAIEEAEGFVLLR